MTSVKCPNCGFVSSRTNANCKRCGAGVAASAGWAPSDTGSGASKVLIIGAAAATLLVIVVVGLALWVKVSAFAGSDPSASQLAALLQSTEVVKQSVNARVVRDLTRTMTRGDLSEDRYLQNHPEVSVLKQLGLATVNDFKVIKPDKQECRRYDWDYSRPVRGADLPVNWGSDQYRRIYRDDGANEECIDVWNYSVTVTVVDPESVDRTALDAKLQYLSTVISPPLEAQPISDQAPLIRAGNFDSKDIPIGAIEIVAVSNVVTGAAPDTYTVGFKYRFKPNALGDVFELARYKSELAALRKFIDEPGSDVRLRNLAKANDSEGLGTGYAELVREGSFGTWKITAVYFQSRPDARYKFHQL